MLPNFVAYIRVTRGPCDGQITSTAKVSICAVPYVSLRSLLMWKLCRSCPMFAPCTGVTFGEHRLDISRSALLSAPGIDCHTQPLFLYRSLSAKTEWDPQWDPLKEN